ncbi:ABC transporter permease [Yinghuangia sp. ASG 101]|uniref:ABC transporter permease n=1 Tax=Yinghuangia sp. ASG 101 TaxID=2896848 RepID=UPI001E5B3A9D|nr:ABC transporter permease [Yinghuangia sp. ASG 101]UGQ09842.1 ABC transporter permease [Yinghuangia sp. ASG 101]
MATEALATVPVAASKPRRIRNRYLRGLMTPRGITGLVLVGVVLVAGLAAPLLTSHDPNFQTAASLQDPGAAGHAWGTDEIGRDLLSRLLYGIRTDLLVVFAAVPIGLVIGCSLALVAITHRAADVAVQRLFDLLQSFPGLILGLTATAIMGPGKITIITVIVLVEIPGFGRMLRGAILVHREREYAVAARIGGAGPLRLLTRHVLPNAADPVVVQVAVSLSIAVILEGAMSFIGIGVRPPDPSLGGILAESRPYLEDHFTYALGPLVVITTLVVGLNLIAEALNRGARR